MSEVVVADSACLIALEQIDYLEVLPALFEAVLIPPEVDREVGGLVRNWLTVEAAQNVAVVNSLKLVLDAGEAEAIALASERGLMVVLDDQKARAVATELNIPVIGTLGCLLKAKRAGTIPLLRPLLDELELNHFFLSETLKSKVLRLAGE